MNRYNASLGKGIGLLAGMTAALAASGAAIAKWTSGVLAGEQSLVNLSAETGVAVGRLQELQFIASVSNSDSQALNQSMLELSKTIGEAAQKGNEDFSRLGISVRDANGQVKDADQVLSEVSQRFKEFNLSRAEQQSFAQALGIEPSLITMMNRTSDEMAGLSARARELGTLTEDQTQFAMEYNDAMTTMRFAMDGVRRLVAVGLGPELKDMAESFTELLVENRDWIVNGIKATIGVLSDFFDMLGRVWPVLAAGAGLFVGLKIATLGFSGALAVLFSPAVLIAAAITGILLIIDDLIVAFQGGKSVIREFFLEFLGWDIQPFLQGIVEGFQGGLSTVLDIGSGFITSFGALLSGIGNILSGNFDKGLEQLGDAFNLWLESWQKAFMAMFGDVFDWAKNAAMDLVPDWVKDLINDDSTGKAPSPVSGIDQSFRPGGSRSSTTNNNRSINQEVTQNIYTSDPERAARASTDNLQRQLDDAQTQFDRGGM